MDDLVTLKDKIGVLQVHVAPLGLVPGDNDVQIADVSRRGHAAPPGTIQI
jgi:hypothetical protein